MSKTKINFERLPKETTKQFDGRVKQSISSMRHHGHKVEILKTTAKKVTVQTDLEAVSYITPSPID